jgi:hypothetical protein
MVQRRVSGFVLIARGYLSNFLVFGLKLYVLLLSSFNLLYLMLLR